MANNWAIVVGINHYEHLSPKKHLQYAVRDAEQIGQFLRTLAEFNVLLCTDTSAPDGNIKTRPSRSNLRRILKKEVRQAKGADNFWFFFSGHGGLGRDRHDYLLTSDCVPGDIEETAVSIDFVMGCLIECQPQNIVLVLDMCRDEISDGSKSIGEVGVQTIEQAKHQGVTTIFSCGRGEESYEIPEIQQGAFTYALLEGLKGCSTAGELEKYLMQRVSQINQKHGKRPQNPLIRVEPGYKYNLPLLVTQSQRIEFGRFQEKSHQLDSSSRSIQALEQRSPQQFNVPSIAGTQTITFDVVTIDAHGQKIEQHQQQSQCLTKSIGQTILEMLVIPGGNFWMGSSERKPSSNEIPVHSVTIQPFLMSRYPITKAQWREVAALEQINRPLKKLPSRSGSANHPIVQISWHEAVEFCDRLSQKTGQTYRLPTEAEWEYACRAGTTTPFHFGETITSELANYDGTYIYYAEPKGVNRGESSPVESFAFANAFGLSDMHGNVWEWCMDDWHKNYNQAPSLGEPWLNKKENLNRVMRGGAWTSEPSICRSACRQFSDMSHRSNNTGFRVVRNL